MSDSGKLATKVVIVLFVFPAFSWLINFLVGFVLGWPMLLLPQSAQDAGLTIFKVVTTVTGFLGGFLICRMIWPRENESSDLPAEIK